MIHLHPKAQSTSIIRTQRQATLSLTCLLVTKNHPTTALILLDAWMVNWAKQSCPLNNCWDLPTPWTAKRATPRSRRSIPLQKNIHLRTTTVSSMRTCPTSTMKIGNNFPRPSTLMSPWGLSTKTSKNFRLITLRGPGTLPL